MSHRKKISKTFAATISSQLCNFIFLPFISRLYSPNEFSQWAIFLVIVMIIGTVATFKYADAIVIEVNNEERTNLFYGSLLAIFISSTIGATIGLFFFSFPIALLLFLSIFGIGFQTLSQQVFLKNTHLGRFVTITFLNSFLVPTFQLISGKFIAPTGLFLIAGATTGYLLTATIGFLLIINGQYLSRKPLDKSLFKTLIRYKKFPLFSMSYTLLSALRLRAIYFFMHNIDPSLNSYYAQSEKLLYAPGNFMGAAVRPIFFNLISQRKIEEIEGQIISLLNAIAKIALPFMAISYIYSVEIINLFFGPKWMSMVFIFRILHFPAFFLLLINWLDRTFDVLDAQFELFRLEIIFVFLTLIIIAIVFLLLNKKENLLIIALTVNSVIYYCFWLWRLFVKANFSSIKFLKMLSVWIITILCWYLFMSFIKNSFDNFFIRIPIMIFGILAYAFFDKDIRANTTKSLK
ncbi:MAG: oligosaccharide flippase family protein [Bacteriovorax sp.]|nr:oligosaccharide flippase family protein [Bacteriovorax sp.]